MISNSKIKRKNKLNKRKFDKREKKKTRLILLNIFIRYDKN